MNVTIEEYVAVQQPVQVVEFDGTTEQAHLLIDNGWLDGCDKGFDQQGSMEVLRGLVGSAIVFPTDLILHHESGDVEVMPAEKFDKVYEATGKTETIEGDAEPAPIVGEVDVELAEPATVEVEEENPVPDDVTAMDRLPDGSNPDAVNLEPDLVDEGDDQQIDPQPVEEEATVE